MNPLQPRECNIAFCPPTAVSVSSSGYQPTEPQRQCKCVYSRETRNFSGPESAHSTGVHIDVVNTFCSRSPMLPAMQALYGHVHHFFVASC